MLQIVLIALGVVVGLIVILAIVIQVQPNTFEIHRSHDVETPVSQVFPLVNDLKRWPDWSPFEKLDPQMKHTYSDQTVGPGAWQAWEGNNKAGAGKITITDSKPNQEIKFDLAFSRPFVCTNKVTFTFVEGAGGTLVTWRMEGGKNFFAKAFHLFVDFDQMLGKDFEEGLQGLGRLAQNVV